MRIITCTLYIYHDTSMNMNIYTHIHMIIILVR